MRTELALKNSKQNSKTQFDNPVKLQRLSVRTRAMSEKKEKEVD